MHLALFILIFAIAVVGRLRWRTPSERAHHWRHTVVTFLLPPLCLLTTAVAILCMGAEGQMVGRPVGRLGYLTAMGFLAAALCLLGWLTWQGWRSLRKIRALPIVTLNGYSCRQLDTNIPFAAQIGFWTPTLVVSRGLFETLTPQHLSAVLVHEQAHRRFRDTFWFFCLGWLRRLTSWLPKTDSLWQELLLLRELRADAWAASHVDAILLAEALLTVVQHHAALEHQVTPNSLCTSFAALTDASTPVSRLEERVAALIDQTTDVPECSWLRGRAFYTILAIALVPVLTIFLHR
ncbi:MAG: M56 family metallopeptidase [Elainellaceae cyanobacterium]